MAYYDGTLESLHTKLTQLLMDNGAAVTKVSVDKLIEFIALRDQSITDRVISDVEKFKGQLDRDTDIERLQRAQENIT